MAHRPTVHDPPADESAKWVGATVRRLRQERSLTQGQLAQRCQALGEAGARLDRYAINRMELKGHGDEGPPRREPTVHELLVLALALEVEPQELFPSPQALHWVQATAGARPHRK